MKRIFLFLVTNPAVLALLAVVFVVVSGVRLTEGGLVELLVLAAVCGFGGSLNNGSMGGFMHLFLIHPPLEARIAALQTQESYDSRK
jgi:hypothetical protein